jgi:PST family polysaccharide transporter
MYVCYLPFVYALARARIGFRWQREVWRQGLVLFGVSVVISILGQVDTALAAIAGIASACAFGLYALVRLAQRTGLHAGPDLGARARLRQFFQMILRTLGSKP